MRLKVPQTPYFVALLAIVLTQVFLAGGAFAQWADPMSNLRTCLDGKYPALCNRSILTQDQIWQADQAEYAANLRTCLDGRYPALCRHPQLNAEHYALAIKAERDANFRSCIDGRYPALCKHNLLSPDQLAQVQAAEYRENAKQCMDGRYPALCKHSLLDPGDLARAREAEYRENAKRCADPNYPALCNRALLAAGSPSGQPVSVPPLPSARSGPGRETASTQVQPGAHRAQSPTAVQPYTYPSPGVIPPPSYYPGCAENGSCYGDISTITGLPKTTHVGGYYRRDGTYVRGHYRSRR